MFITVYYKHEYKHYTLVYCLPAMTFFGRLFSRRICVIYLLRTERLSPTPVYCHFDNIVRYNYIKDI